MINRPSVKLVQINNLQNPFPGTGQLFQFINLMLESTLNVFFYLNLRLSHLSKDKIEMVFPLPQKTVLFFKQNLEGLLMQAGLQTLDFFFKQSSLQNFCSYEVQHFSFHKFHSIQSDLRIKLEISRIVQETIKIDLESVDEVELSQKIFILNPDQQIVAEIDLQLKLRLLAGSKIFLRSSEWK